MQYASIEHGGGERQQTYVGRENTRLVVGLLGIDEQNELSVASFALFFRVSNTGNHALNQTGDQHAESSS